MTFAEIRERIYYSVGRGQDLSSLNTPITFAVNTVQREINLMLNLKELMVFDKTSLKLAANTTSYDLPTDFLKMIAIWDNDQYQTELTRITPTEYLNYLSDVDTDTGTYPNYYDIIGTTSNVKRIYLFPLKTSLTTGTITAVADYSATVAGTVLVTDAAHGLATGNTITIAGTTNYNGTFSITYVSVDTFYITETFVASETGTWTRVHYVPFIYIKKLTDLSSDSDTNPLTVYYPDLLIEGGAYILCRDNIYIDNPERIAFRKGEYQNQIELVKLAQRQPDRINKISPKRILPSTNALYSVQMDT